MRRFPGVIPIAGLCGWVVLAALVGAAPSASAAPTPAVEALVRSDRATLDSLYAAGSASPIPNGFLPGRVIVDPGSRSTVRKSRVLSVAWQGKVFMSDGTAKNRVLGLTAVPMQMYEGTSWVDGGPVVVLDYSESWRMFRGVRDEIREVSPGVFLGRTYVKKKSGYEPATMFVLDAQR